MSRLPKERENPYFKVNRFHISEMKKRPCRDCGVSYPPCVMEFDHREPKDKRFNISQKWRFISFSALTRETSKCDVVCANCHRIREFNREAERT